MKDKRYIKRAIILLAIIALFVAPLVDALSFLREPGKYTRNHGQKSVFYSEPGTLSETYSTPLREGSSATRIIGDYGLNDENREGRYYYRPKSTVHRQTGSYEFMVDTQSGRHAISKTGLTVNFENKIEQDDVKRAPFRRSRLYADMNEEYEAHEDFGKFELKSSRWLAGDYTVKKRQGKYYYSGSNRMYGGNKKLY